MIHTAMNTSILLSASRVPLSATSLEATSTLPRIQASAKACDSSHNAQIGTPCTLNAIFNPNRLNTTIAPVVAMPSVGEVLLWIGGGLLALSLAYKVRKRVKAEWDDKYRPFRDLDALNAMLKLEKPSVRGALTVFRNSFGKRQALRQVAFRKPLVFGQPSAKETDAAENLPDVTYVAGPNTIIFDDDPNELMHDPDINREGAHLAKTFVGLLRTKADEIEAEFTETLKRQSENPDGLKELLLVTAIKNYAAVFLRLPQCFEDGLGALGSRDPKYAYFRKAYAPFLARYRQAYGQSGLSKMLLDIQVRPVEDETYLCAGRIFENFRDILDDLDEYLDRMEQGKLLDLS